MIDKAIQWVLVGIFMALGFWEVFKYLDKRLTQTRAENEMRAARIEVPRKITSATDILGIENFLKSVGHVQSAATKMAKAEALADMLHLNLQRRLEFYKLVLLL